METIGNRSNYGNDGQAVFTHRFSLQLLRERDRLGIRKISRQEGDLYMDESKTCPHCGAEMDPIETPLMSSWGGEIHYVCFNDECCYFKESWDVLESQGIERTGYRCSIDPRGACSPMAVWSSEALKDLMCKGKLGEKAG